jgi:Tol biopolymer transport system component
MKLPYVSALIFLCSLMSCPLIFGQSKGTRLFAPDIVSTGDNDFSITFTPNGKTIYFTRTAPDRGGPFTILTSHFANGKWNTPQIASFSGMYSDADPFLSPDGSKLFYMSRRPIEGTAERPDFDIWMVSKTAGGWSKPQHLDDSVNTAANEIFPSVASDGTLYFASDRPGGKGGNDIYRSRFAGGKYSPAESLGDIINTPTIDSNPSISPDQNTLFFISDRPGGLGGSDVYVCQNHNGTWSTPKNLGNLVNSSAGELAPALSPDHKYFYFTSNRRSSDFPTVLTKRPTSREMMKKFRSHGNGLGDIYYISIKELGLNDGS